MKERPIIFSGPMVRAILDGRKTQTRRVIKPQPPRGLYNSNNSGFWMTVEELGHAHGPYICPYGVPDDRLWVRETFRVWEKSGCGDCSCDVMDGPIAHLGDDWGYTKRDVEYRASFPPQECRDEYLWRPSIHMPRWASRITLEITGVRVQRVQEISEEDALAEGSEEVNYMDTYDDDGIVGHYSYVVGFMDLWDSINAKKGHGWKANPWVWVIEFRKVGEDGKT